MQLRRVIGVPTATGVGVAAMLGAGVFSVWAPAAAHAGAGLLAALAIAWALAALNAVSTVRLARAHPRSGGVFAFGRAEGSPRAAFAAGVLFLFGKLASAAAIARVAAEYLAPDAAGPVAAVLLVALAAVNASGVRSTAIASAVTALVVVAVVSVAVAAGITSIDAPHALEWPDTPAGILPAATLVFFAFAGYARVATLSGEVRDPRRTLPIAVALSLAVVGVLATAVALALVWGLGADALAASTAPLAELAGDAWRPLVVAGVLVACAGSALGVLAGLSRTAQAMAAAGELPRPLGTIAARTATPVRADAVVAVLAAVAALLLPSPALIGTSAGAVLGYYAISHALAWGLGGRAGRVVAAVGMLGCLLLALWAPPISLAVATGVLVAAFVARLMVQRRRLA